MKENNNGKTVLIVCLIIIIIALGTLLYLAVNGKLSYKNTSTTESENTATKNNAAVDNTKEEETENTENDNNNCKCNCTSYVSESFGNGIDDIDYTKLEKISKSDYNFIKGAYNNDYSINVLSNGKVLINFNNYISNITNAKDLIMFIGPGGDKSVYILTDDGDVYKYNLDDISDGKYTATKIDKYSNIKQILRYKTRKANAGGCDFVVLIDNNDKYYELDSYCV